MDLNALADFAGRYGVTFADARLLEQAFVTEKFAKQEGGMYWDSYEPLEFIGDSVLEVVIRRWLVRRRTSREVIQAMKGYFGSNYFLGTEIGMRFGFLDLLQSTERERINRHSYRLAADLVESFIGAVFQDQGFDVAERVTLLLLEETMKEAIATGLYNPEKLLARSVKDLSVTYEVEEQHAQEYLFKTTLLIGDHRFEGFGARETISRMEAAKHALKELFDISLNGNGGHESRSVT